ncbi:MAG: DNA-directed RNA polymerase subunit omega [Lachnospiraceae bacterium]|nr:DNA-directed RNA polymerase subunit omega [Lachnospiraceae bacterium]
MLHPSYTDLINVVNEEALDGDSAKVSSRYSIVMATAKRARQLVAGDEALVPENGDKPLSVAVRELEQGAIRILDDDEEE